jgi:prepilin peptidase CpaA
MLDFAVLAIFPGIMVFAAISDLFTMTIPNRISLILIAGFFALAFAIGLPLATIGWHAAAGALVLAICFTLFSFGWIGGGDAKFAATTALWLGFGVLGMYSVLAAIFGGILTLCILQLRRIRLSEERWAGTWIGRLHDKNIGVPYGVALAAAGLAVYPETAIWLAARSI